MTAKGHVLLALPIAIYEAGIIGLQGLTAGLFFLVVIVGVLWPDIDEERSYIGKKLTFLAWTIKLVSIFLPAFKHRGITHVIILPLSLVILSILMKNIWIAGFALGWMLHTVGDLITVGGINGYLYPLWPERKIVLLPDGMRFYTGSFAEQVLIAFLIIINGYMMFKFLGVVA